MASPVYFPRWATAMSIEEMNQYWEALASGAEDDCGRLREKYADDQNLTSVLDMLDELFELSLEVREQESIDLAETNSDEFS